MLAVISVSVLLDIKMRAWDMFAQVSSLILIYYFYKENIYIYIYICAEIDECLDDPCDLNATCTNTDGGYMCECNTGFTGDGETCISEIVFDS